MTTESITPNKTPGAELFEWFVVLMMGIPTLIWGCNKMAPVAFSVGILSATIFFIVNGFTLYMTASCAYASGKRIHKLLVSDDSLNSALPDH